MDDHIAENTDEITEHMLQACKTRPLRYSDLDHLKKGSTMFLHEAGYSPEDVANALDLDLKDVENNLKGTGFERDYRKLAPFESILPASIGDTITIRVPAWGNSIQEFTFKAEVIQCIPRGGSCGLSVRLVEDASFEIPLFGMKRKGEEIVVPLEWYLR